MQLIHLTCSHCGAPLEVPQEAKFVTCRFCSSRLVVEHSASAVFTRVIEALEQHAGDVSRDLETIKLQNQIEQLDREWQMDREQASRRGKNGRLQEPSVWGTVGGMAVLALFGLGWFTLWNVASKAAWPHPAPAFFSLIGLGIVVFAVVGLILGIPRARGYANRKAIYEARRRKLLGDIRNLEMRS